MACTAPLVTLAGAGGGGGGDALKEALAELSRKMDSQTSLLQACLQRIEVLESRAVHGGCFDLVPGGGPGAAGSTSPACEEASLRQADEEEGSGRAIATSDGAPLAGAKTMWRRSWKLDVWQTLEYSDSSVVAYLYNRMSMLAILACVVLSIIDLLVPAFPSEVVLVFEVAFAAEVALRWFVCPNRHVFWFDVYNVVDLVAILAGVVPRIVVMAIPIEDWATAEKVIIFSPAFWMLRLLRRFEHFHLLRSAFTDACQVLPVLLYTLLLISFFAAGLLYLVESREVIPSLTDSVWFIVVTMSTVGYGDISPETGAGKLITMAVIVLALLYTAIPIGIVGTAFANCWDDRERLLLVQQVQRIVLREGITEQDLSDMFNTLDKDRSGRLSFEEFVAFLPMLRIKKKKDIVFKVFQAFDNNDTGLVDWNEFLAVAFPAQKYYYMARRMSRQSLESQ